MLLWIAAMTESARSERAPTLEQSGELLAELREGIDLPGPPENSLGRAPSPNIARPFSDWLAFGDALEARYGISQFAFLRD